MGAIERAERVARDLVEQAQRGDREAFAILARTRGDTLFGIARRILRDVNLAEDAVQQALVIAWRELPHLRDPDRFDTWLQRTLVHACYAEARRKRAWNANIRVLPIDGPAGPDELASMIDRDEVERGFRRLSPEQRAILVLHHYLGLSLNEIGKVLDIPAGTARSRLHYAHRAMRALLEADARPAAAAGGGVR
jgi:RNA polymerase sigma-70 factor (ECF subfamily)